jgi:hypothetical protein
MSAFEALIALMSVKKRRKSARGFLPKRIDRYSVRRVGVGPK